MPSPGDKSVAARSARSPAGRPRSDDARDATLVAAWQLFTELGLRRMTVEAIAGRAGVAKTTIYRWWPSKEAVVLDALHRHLDTTISFGDSGSVRTDLTRQVRAVIRLLRSPPGTAYLALLAESRHDPMLAEELRERYLRHRRAAATEVIERGIARGELDVDVDAGLLIDTIYGAVYYRFLVASEPPPATYAARVVDLALAGASA